MSLLWKLFVLGLICSVFSVSEAAKCKICDSATNDKCATAPDSITETVDCTGECFLLVENNGSVKRGCFDNTANCVVGVNCKKCTAGDNTVCDPKVPFTCKGCDSTTDPNCSKDPTKILNKICDDGINKCLTQIKTDKHIERRCASKSDETCQENKNCDTCLTTGCNKDIFPKNRRLCYQCESSAKCANPSANTADILSQPCVLYDEADKCFVYGVSDNDMTRGCTSDITSFPKCQEAKEKCRQCDTDSCNKDAFKKTQSIKCIQCKSDDTNCAWGFTESDAKECEIEFWQTEGCYTNKIEAAKVERGCLQNPPKDVVCGETGACTACTTANACNKADAMEFSCYKCRSDENPNCSKIWEKDNYPTEKCRNPVSKDGQGCYTERWNGVVIRSCLVDTDEKSRKNCLKTEYKMCDSCLDANCNKLAAPGSAQGLALASSLLALALIVTRFF